MPFKKGHKIGRHGRQNPPGGRPTFEQAVEKAARKKASFLAAEMLNKLLQDHLGDVAAVYIGAASGKKPSLKKGGRSKDAEIDLTTVRHYIERFSPPAPRKIDLGTAETMEDFVGKLFRGEFIDPDDPMEDAELVNPTQIEDKNGKS